MIDEKVQQEIDDVLKEMERIIVTLRQADVQALRELKVAKECLHVLREDVGILEERLGIQKATQL